MTLFDFQQLSVDEQARIVETDGAFLSSRVEGTHIVCLFALHDFYVETFFDTVTSCTIRARSFYNIRYLEAYLRAIRLEPVPIPSEST